jgi:hypothetical protein
MPPISPIPSDAIAKPMIKPLLTGYRINALKNRVAAKIIIVMANEHSRFFVGGLI